MTEDAGDGGSPASLFFIPALWTGNGPYTPVEKSQSSFGRSVQNCELLHTRTVLQETSSESPDMWQQIF